MAKKNQPVETQTSLDQFNDRLTEMSLSVKKNQKKIFWICILAAVVIAGLLYYFMVSRPKAEQAKHDHIAVADREAMLGNDSVAIEIYREVAANGGQAGNRAKLQAAIMLYNQGKDAEALQLVSDYDAKEALIGAAAYSLKGDCLVNLDRLDEAVEAFKKAIKQSDNNPFYTPYFMQKLALVYGAQGNYDAQMAQYQEIMDKYPVYNEGQGINIEKELELARINAGK